MLRWLYQLDHLYGLLLTFGLARLISDVLARSGAWSRFFGRERFFLIILISVIGGLSAFGAGGIVVGPVVAALFLSVWQMFGTDTSR